jgi:hypothetical protein
MTPGRVGRSASVAGRLGRDRERHWSNPVEQHRTRFSLAAPRGAPWRPALARNDSSPHTAAAEVRVRFDVLVDDPACSESRLASLQTAIHQLEGDIFRWTKSLNLGAVQAKSPRHQHAALIRWHGAS